MKSFDVSEVAGDLEWLVSLLESGEEAEIVILREGRQAARLVLGIPDSSCPGSLEKSSEISKRRHGEED